MIIPADDDKRFRFKVGGTAHTRDKRQVTITQRLLHLSECGVFCPHYLAVDEKGVEWRISQFELSAKEVGR